MSGPIDVHALDPVIALQRRFAGLHPALERCHPLAVALDAEFHIYDLNETGEHYCYMQSNPLPMPIPEGVRAAFPLNEYGGRIACVVTPEVFDELDGYVTILHEFIHCYQYTTSEAALRRGLTVARQAEAAGDMLWELQYDFPYMDPAFATLFARFMTAVGTGDLAQADGLQQGLKAALSAPDYEYLVWQEWKEGFARFIENRLQEALGNQQNLGGSEMPFNRVSFYPAGAAYIDLIERESPGAIRNLSHLFQRLFQPGDLE